MIETAPEKISGGVGDLELGKKYEKLAHRLREDIRQGVLRPGDRLPSLSELRTQFNLSRATIDRVHQSLEQEGLIVREQGRGTFVAQNAKPSVGFIGLSCYEYAKAPPQAPYWMMLQEGVREAAGVAGNGLVLMHHRNFDDWDKIDGLILSDPYYDVHPPTGIPEDLPLVSVVSTIRGVPSVISDDFEGGRLATEHLLQLGHRRIACICDWDSLPVGKRLAGYYFAMGRELISPPSSWIKPYSTHGIVQPDFAGRAQEIMRAWFKEDWHEVGFTAVLAMNDRIAQGVITALEKVGLRVPEDVSVIGYDDADLCDYLKPRLTSITVPVREMGRKALEVMKECLARGATEEIVMQLPVKLHVRESTAPAKD